MKTLIGISTFGNLPFTQLTINSIRATTKASVDFFVVVGKPGDVETTAWLKSEGIAHWVHDARYGFPVALNDMMDYAWKFGVRNAECGIQAVRPYDNLIIAGNDIVAYPGAVDALITEADRGEHEWVCSSQFDAKSLVARYPEVADCFTGPNLNFEEWSIRVSPLGIKEYTPTVWPWEIHKDFHGLKVERDCIKDVRNLCLFKRSVFEKIGYADVNFWPGGYFEDNDYCKRARLAGVKACGLAHSAYFHFWSRTIHQVLPGMDGKSAHDRQFERNGRFYTAKWGGPFDRETFALPFNGKRYWLGHEHSVVGAPLSAAVKIDSREHEAAIVDYWRSQP